MRWTAMVFLAAMAATASAAESNRMTSLPDPFRRLLPLHAKLGKPVPGDWLAEHHEPGQSYAQYVQSRPVRPDRKRRVIYVQPLGEFTPTQKKIVALAAEHLGLHFGLPTRLSDDLPLDLIPETARRKHPEWGGDQVLSTFVLQHVLKPRLPDDAVACIAFTASDLWPGAGWNFVFGQASLSDRVGVWSIHRFGDPDASDAAYKLCLRRTLKIGSHETGHIFSIPHCIYYQCNMCAGNHLEEMDRFPLWLCPNCLAKVCWATGQTPREHYAGLVTFFQREGLDAEREFCEKSLQRVTQRTAETPKHGEE